MKKDMERLVSSILQVEANELDDIVNAVIETYHRLHPDWDMQVFVLPINDADAYSRSVESIVDFLRKHKPKTPA